MVDIPDLVVVDIFLVFAEQEREEREDNAENNTTAGSSAAAAFAEAEILQPSLPPASHSRRLRLRRPR